MRTFFKKLCIVLVAITLLCGAAGCRAKDSADTLIFHETEEGYAVAINPSAASDVTTIEVPATYQDRPVVKIADYGFANCGKMTQITLPEGLKEIGIAAFSNCTSLVDVAIPSTVTTVKQYAFADCSSLEAAVLPDSVVTLEKYAYAFCKQLKTVRLSAGIETIGKYTFYDCGALTVLHIPSKVHTVENNAFEKCTSLTAITFGSGIKQLDLKAFIGCNQLATLAVEDSNDNFITQDNILYSKHTYELLYAPPMIEGDITIHANAKIIPANLFAYNDRIVSVTVPASVSTVGACAFLDCNQLIKIDFADKAAEWGDANGNTVIFADAEDVANKMTGRDPNIDWSMSSWSKKR